MAAKKRAVIFDFDGVVADSWALHESCWQTVLKHHGATLDDATYQKALGWTSIETAKVLVKEIDVQASAEELAEEKSTLMVEHAKKNLPKMPGVDAALARLREDYALGLMSGRRKVLVGPALTRFGLADTFDLVVTSDDREPGDELDDLLVQTAERLEVRPNQAVMVDDSRNGLLAAERAGLKTIAFNSNPKVESDYSIADAEIKSLNELVPELVTSVFAS